MTRGPQSGNRARVGGAVGPMSVEKSSRLLNQVASRLSALCGGLALDTAPVVDTFRELVAPWTAGVMTSWQSEISDDNTPIELSVSLDGNDAALRILFEPQAAEPTLQAYRAAGLALHDQLEAHYRADLDRFRRVTNLFLPERLQGRFAVWSSVVFAHGQRPAFKAYLNPNARGPGEASALVEEALGRLGLGHAWRNLSEATRRGPHLDELKYFALDLAGGPHARVKVYVHHHGATPADLEAACAASGNHVEAQTLAFVRALRGGDEPMQTRAPFTCHAFNGERPTRATSTVYVPVCAYAHDDRVVAGRVIAYLHSVGVDAALYRRAVVETAPRPLEDGVGLQSWVALRRDAERTRLTVYIATEARHRHPPGSVPAPSADPLACESLAAVLALFEKRPFDAHPLLRRLLRAPSVAAAELLAQTLHEGIARDFAVALSVVAARVDPQLRERLTLELSSSPAASAFATLRPASHPPGPGHRLRVTLARGQRSDDIHEAIATLLGAEIALRLLVGPVERLLTGITNDDRNGLEDGHALGQFIPRGDRALAAATRGAVETHRAVWRALDEVYALAFAEEP